MKEYNKARTYEEKRSGDGERLLVQIGADEQRCDVAEVLFLVVSKPFSQHSEVIELLRQLESG